MGFWSKLDEMLRNVVSSANGGLSEIHRLPADNLVLQISKLPTPLSLARQHPGAQSIEMTIHTAGRLTRMRRIFHGCYMRGRNVGYYKPSDRKTGDLWSNHFTDPKTKQVRFYELYGGKLAGILTQSFCRELFMHSLLRTANWCQSEGGAQLIGQFHDEIVVDWTPGHTDLDTCKHNLGAYMGNPPPWAVTFPLEADIKDDYRYTK
jgi:hypothetical protein